MIGLLLCLSLIPTTTNSVIATDINFHQIDVEDGLSQSYVYSIIQDHTGLMWIATQDGVNRFDGREFKVFRHKPEDSTSLSESDTRVVFEDSQNNLWVGTQGNGLNLFDRASQSFKHFNFDQNGRYKNANIIVEMIEDEIGNLWLGTRQGVVKFNPKDQTSKVYTIAPEHELAINNQVRDLVFIDQSHILLATGHGLKLLNVENAQVTDYIDNEELKHNQNLGHLIKDRQGNFWLGSLSNGLYFIDSQTKQIKQIDGAANEQVELGIVHSLYQDSNDTIWVGTRSKGLFYIDKSEHKLIGYQAEQGDSMSLSHNNVQAIYQDKTGLFWLGTWSGGINTFNLNKQNFHNFLAIPHKINSLSDENIWSLLKTQDGHYWFGSSRGGLNRYNPETQEYQVYRHKEGDLSSLTGDQIWSLYERDDGLIWVGTYQSGLNLFDPELGEVVKSYQAKTTLITEDLPKSVLSISQASDGNWWFGTRLHGVVKFDEKSEKFTFYRTHKEKNNSIGANKIFTSFLDKQDRLWFGTAGGGLSLYQPQSDDFKTYTQDNNSTRSINGNYVLALSEDQQGRLLIGTDKGLNILLADSSFKSISVRDGLPNDNINGVLSDCNNNTWVATNRGLSLIDSTNQSIVNFDKRNGLVGQEYNAGAFAKFEACELMFGSSEGAVSFIPKNNQIPTRPELVLTSVLKYYQPIKMAQDISEMKQFDMSYRDRVVSFSFSLTDYNNPFQHEFSYRINTGENEWINIGHKNQIDFTNLSSGYHELQVIGKTDGYNWSQIKNLTIFVQPPFWQTVWAYLFYGLLIVSSFGYYLYQHRKKIIEQKLITESERKISRKLRRLDKLKDQFLANTSHELRTPLNAIIGLSNVILEEKVQSYQPDELEGLVKLIRGSGESLLTLVNDILDYSALNENKLTMHFDSVELDLLIDNLILEMNFLNKNKSLKITAKIDNDLPPIEADQKRLYQVLLNLLGNAIKFTSVGQIIISANKIGKNVEITVSDTGIGIPEKLIDSIFNRFEQAEGSSKRQYGGAGLGLAITKELVELHNGKLSVSSTESEGSEFVVLLPIMQIEK